MKSWDIHHSVVNCGTPGEEDLLLSASDLLSFANIYHDLCNIQPRYLAGIFCPLP